MNPETKFFHEQMERLINGRDLRIEAPGPLLNPATEISIVRTSSLELELNISSTHAESVSNERSYPSGTLFQNTDSAILKNDIGHIIILNGVQPIGHTESAIYISGHSCRTQKSTISNIEVSTGINGQTEYVIEHLANVDKSRYIWPDASTSSQSTEWKIQFEGGATNLSLDTSITNEALNRNCIQFEVDGIRGIIGCCNDDSSTKIIKPGYIIYHSLVSADIRNKIRHCISFTLGMMIVHLGDSEYSSDWKLLKIRAFRGYDIGGNAYNIAVSPPAPLSFISGHYIDPDLFLNMLNGLYGNYVKMKFNHVQWAYWHALSAVLHISGVHYGAAIEHIINSYLENNKEKVSKVLLEPQKWETLHDSLLATIAQEKLDADTAKIFTNKINSNLNQTPASVLSNKVLDSLGIRLTEIEKKAWGNRNKAAHGMEVTSLNAIDAIQDIKILRTILTRLIIRYASGSEYYINYAEIGHPIMKIEHT